MEETDKERGLAILKKSRSDAGFMIDKLETEHEDQIEKKHGTDIHVQINQAEFYVLYDALTANWRFINERIKALS